MMKSGSRWVGGAGRQTASGFGAVRSGPWSAVARDGQSWAAGGAAGEGEGEGCSPDEAGVVGEDGGCAAAAVGVGGRRGRGRGG